MDSVETNPLVSVIVPAHNCEAYLGEALTSLVRQTISDIEIIVVDDGSTDKTARVAHEYAERDCRIRVISRDTASGRPACARNLGLKIARGKYIALLDADDVAVPTRFEASIAAMRSTGARFAFADYKKLYQDTGAVEGEGFLKSAGLVQKAAKYLKRSEGNVYLCSPKFAAFLLTFTAVHTPTVIFERSLLSGEAGFDESLVCYEDVDLWFRLAEHTQFVFVNEVQAIYRKHAASLTTTYDLGNKRDGVALWGAHLRRLKPRLTSEEIRAANRAASRVLFQLSYTSWCAGRLSVARAGFLASWQAAPTRRAAVAYIKAFVPRDVGLALMVAARGFIQRRPAMNGRHNVRRAA